MLYDSYITTESIFSYILLMFGFLYFVPNLRRIRFYFMLKYSFNFLIELAFRFYYTKNVYAKYVTFSNIILMDYDRIIIGRSSGFLTDCIVIRDNHDLLSKNLLKTKPAIIGKKFWIATRAIILHAVSVGDNVVIGAGSVFTKYIPANITAAGNSASVIRKCK